MCGKTDVIDFACCLGFHEGFQCAPFAYNCIQLLHTWVMYLIQINVICPKISKTFLNICCHGILSSGHTLGGKHKLVPDSL